MTVLLNEYLTHLAQGHGHPAALQALSRRFDLDKATVGRVIERAQRAQGGGSKTLTTTPRHPAVAVSLPDRF